MDGGAWWATVDGVTKSQTQLSDYHFHFYRIEGMLDWRESEFRLPQGTGQLSLFTFMHWRRKWQPTPVFLPGESQGRGSLVGCRLWGRTESATTEAT